MDFSFPGSVMIGSLLPALDEFAQNGPASAAVSPRLDSARRVHSF